MLILGSSLLEILDEDGDLGPDCLDKQEQETYTELVDHLVKYPELREGHMQSLSIVSIRRFATYVVDQEMVALTISNIVKQVIWPFSFVEYEDLIKDTNSQLAEGSKTKLMRHRRS